MLTGRFAPSPSGPLHFGSVTVAVASFLNVRVRGGRWLLRIDDLDPPREQPGAADAIVATIEALGLEWDGAVLYQSQRSSAYAAMLEQLERRGATFACACTRRELGAKPYPGTCRTGIKPGRVGRSLRVRVDDETVSFVDAVQGAFAQNLAIECGDFIVRRADGLIAYHLAVAVDDAFSGVTEVLRGADLLDSTPRQIWLQRLLGLPTPSYAHIPLVIGANGKKLSKQFGAPGISAYEARSALYHALIFLGLSPPPDLAGAAPAELLAWAIPRWRLELPGVAPRSYSWPLAEVNIARNSS